MAMNDVIDLVNSGNAKYKFSRFGSCFVGLNEYSFTPAELNSQAKGFIKFKNSMFFRRLK